ncbi:AsmA family protein [Methylobacterium sp. C25]|uniref:AsmA family protein n=1 Tax=Methylobacterium sp. C25 TaxID=2721622 RepID=UPI001F34B58B|nr:AsmA family protein [Methylobacterium sp. C25]MCE4224423.1 AsmA family protein [Methylobacterium sp. C25]
MRDILTALAGAVILILVAALAAPPFLDWTARRSLIDQAIGASLGLPAHSDGRIELRLLPSPRLRLDVLHLGGDLEKPSLELASVKAELALAPLLKGEFRFTETRIGRAELKLPVSDGDALMLPGSLSEALGGRDLVIEDLHIQQALVTTLIPATGRTEQFAVEALRLKAPSLAGPWQMEGASGGVPFRLASTKIATDGATVKVSGGGERQPRFEADARIVLKPVESAHSSAPAGMRAFIPEAEGSARVVVGPPTKDSGPVMPFSLAGKFKARGMLARFESVNVEIDPTGQAVRLAGTGQIDLRAWRAGLSLESRRINLDGLLYSSAGQALLSSRLSGDGALPIMLDLDLKAESVAFGFEDWSDVQAKGTLDRTGGLILRRFAGLAPGAAKVDASGEFDVSTSPRFTGHLAVDAASSEGFGRYLHRFGIEGPALSLLDGRPVQVVADVEAAANDLSLKGLRLSLGETRLSGDAHYVRGGGTVRGRLEATLQVQGVDIAELPPFGGLLPSLDRHDVGLTIRARNVRYGPAGPRSGNGTITASIQSDGASLVVDRLDIADLAGANARLSGRIAPDGAGRIAGHVGAPSAAPLLALLDRVWIPEARLLPAFLREGALDLDVSLERESGQADTLRTTAKGRAAESTIDGSLLSRGGRLDSLDATIAAPRAGRWFKRNDIVGLRQPASLTVKARRAAGAATPLSLTVSGTVAGLDVATVKPLMLGTEPGPPDAGTLHLATTDASPFLSLAGSAAPATGPLPADLTLALSRKDTGLHVEANGRLAEADASASLDRSADGSLAGKASLGALSLPGLAAALVLPTDPKANAEEAGGWSQARFLPVPARPRADLSLSVGRLGLGRELVAEGAAFELSLDGDALSLKNLSGRLAGGQVSGSATIARQGGGVSVSGDGAVSGVSIQALSGTSIQALAGGGPIRANLSLSLRYSSVGNSAAALAANLGGSGEATLAEITVPAADPSALDRTLTRALAEDDPLREGRLATLLSEEFDAGALSAKGPVTAPVTLGGGTLRSGPVDLDFGAARWNGSFILDLRTKRMDARGTLTAASAPKGWSGGKPSVQLGFVGPLNAPKREIEPGALSNGLSALVLQRELEKIEQFEADQVERQRRRARIEMDQARAAALKAAAEKAAQEKAAREKAAEDAARIARMRAQQAAAEEQARQARDRQNADDEIRRSQGEPPAEPLDIRPPQEAR